MTQWLFSSRGHPIAFVSGDNVFSRGGQFLGRFDGNEVWHGRYVGEIVERDLLLYRRGKGSVVRGTPGTPGTPGLPGLPGSRGSRGLPSGYDDLDLDNDE
jgi:hypothetical protein